MISFPLELFRLKWALLTILILMCVFFLMSVGRERAKSAVLRYYHALSRLAWPYQFLGSVVEFQERKRHGTVQYGCPQDSKRPEQFLTRHCCYMISMRKNRPYHITALTVLVRFTGSSQIWRLWLYG